jgi:hypothetical protein
MSRRLKVLAVSIFIGLFGLMAVPGAQAQLPPVPGVPGAPGVPGTPGVPSVPPAVMDAIESGQSALIPVFVDLASTAQPVPNAAGFALRGPCSATGTVIVLLVIGGGAVPLPVNPGFFVTPVLLMCGAAYDEGPADPVFETVDDAAGPQFSDTTKPVLKQVSDALAPARPNIAQACAVIALSGGTATSLPKPLHRVNLVDTLC